MHASPLDAARELAALARRHRDATESGRRLAQPLVVALGKARLCRLLLPEELGGLACTPVEALKVYEELAAGEASLPWIAWNNALVCLHARFMDDPVRREVFADPSGLFAQSTRPGGTAVAHHGGYRLSGRWSLVSGCELADWLFLLSRVEEGGRPRSGPDGSSELRFLLVRRGDCEMLDTWHSGGLRGSGSHDVVVSDVPVPTSHAIATSAAPGLPAPLGTVPINAVMVAGFAAQALGIARSALDALTAQARAHGTPGPVPALRDRSQAQAGVALHGAALAAARSHLHDCVSTLWSHALAGKAPALEQIGAVMGAALHANEVARETVDEMYALGGTRSLYSEGVLDRAHRDLHAMLRHIVAQPLWAEDAGRVVFGLEPASPLFAF